jgi:hypothetical protein
MAQEDVLFLPALAFDVPPAAFAIESNVAAALNALRRFEFTVPQIQVDVSALGAILEDQRKAAEALQQAFGDNIAAAAEQAAHGFNELSTRFREALKKAAVIGKYGWTISKDAPLPDIFYIVEAAKDKASADSAFLWYFAQDDNAYRKLLVKRTLSNPSLSFWKPTLEDAVTCLDKEMYRPCISLLIPLVEGVCAKQFSTKFHEERSRDQYFKKRLRAFPDESIDKLMWLSFKAFAETFFQYLPFGSGATGPILNRHLLLHGRENLPNTLEDCLRLLQVLETITDLAV